MGVLGIWCRGLRGNDEPPRRRGRREIPIDSLCSPCLNGESIPACDPDDARAAEEAESFLGTFFTEVQAIEFPVL